MGIESYSIVTTHDKNILTVAFAIIGKAMEPKDYQPLLERFKAICEEFNSASRHETE